MRSQRHIRFLHLPLAVVAATASSLILAASPVAAAAPANDSFADAEPLTLGTPVTADTTEATPEALDLEVIQACPFGTPPGTTNTVWYAWDSGEDPPPTVSVRTSGSSFQPFFGVATGELGSFTTLTCGSAAVVFDAEPDIRYYVLLFGIFGGAGVTTLILDEARQPTIELTVDPIGRFDPRTGTATISGHYLCSDATFADAFGLLTQTVGRFKVVGFFDTPLICDAGNHDWTAVVTSDTGKFAGGKAIVTLNASACAFPMPLCVNVTGEQTVSLRR